MGKKKHRREESGIEYVIKKTLTGSGVMLAVLVVLILVFTQVALKMDMEQKFLPIFALASAAIAAIVGGFTAIRPTRRNGLLFGALSAMPVVIIFLLFMVLMKDVHLGQNTLITAVIMPVFAAMGGIAAVNIKKKRK